MIKYPTLAIALHNSIKPIPPRNDSGATIFHDKMPARILTIRDKAITIPDESLLLIIA